MIKRTRKLQQASAPTTQVGFVPALGLPVSTAPAQASPAKVRYAKRDWVATDVITLVQSANPKKGKSFHRYALYATGMTVADYAEAIKGAGLGGKTIANADLRWDVARGFISIAPKQG